VVWSLPFVPFPRPNLSCQLCQLTGPCRKKSKRKRRHKRWCCRTLSQATLHPPSRCPPTTTFAARQQKPPSNIHSALTQFTIPSSLLCLVRYRYSIDSVLTPLSHTLLHSPHPAGAPLHTTSKDGRCATSLIISKCPAPIMATGTTSVETRVARVLPFPVCHPLDVKSASR